MNNIKEMLETLSTPEEREALRKARLSSLNRDLAPFKLGKQAWHGVNPNAKARRRAANRVARKSRRGRRG